MRRLLALFLLVFAAPAQAETPSLPWAKWDPSLFDRAAREDKYILLHMAAVWCHWCHVMERTTYRDAAIQQRIAEKFIAVRVDQDSDPALSYRYENWGWPATIMLDKDGNEIFKRRGYIPPELFGKLLAAVIEDPSALTTYTAGATVDPNAVALSAERRARTEDLLQKSYDKANGGFGDTHRFIHGDTLEWVLERGRALQRNAEPEAWREMSARTLAGARRLIDPVWGGMFQYSDKLDWSGPHYEKLLNIQRDAVRAYVLAWQISGDPADLAAARDIARWLMDFMRAPSGAFYTSQDADAGPTLHGDVFYARTDAERRAGPQPPIDRNAYARENGWAIASLAALYDVTGEPALIDAAVRAFDWVLAERRAPNGGFGHARASDDDTHLGDTLSMAEAALALYRSTAERRYLALAIELGEVIVRDHRDPSGGFMVRAARARREGRAGQAGEAARRERGHGPAAQPAGARIGAACLQGSGRARHALPDRARRGRPDRARRPAGRPRAFARARPHHHRRRQGRSGRARPLRGRPHLPDALLPPRMARPPRGPAAGGRRRVPGAARSRRLRLRQRRLLDPGLHAG